MSVIGTVTGLLTEEERNVMRNSKPKPGFGDTLIKLERDLNAGRDYFRSGHYETAHYEKATAHYEKAKELITSSRQGYIALGQQTKVKECDELLVQCAARLQLPSLSSTVVRTGSVTHHTGAPASSYRSLTLPPPSTPSVGTYDERTQNLLDRLSGVKPKGTVVHLHFPTTSHGFKTPSQSKSDTM